jgi:tRNA-specific 2-thiouridylase
VAAAKPLYALRSEPRSNVVVVGPRESLACRKVSVSGRLHIPVRRGEVKLRYRSPAIPAAVEEADRGFRLHLDAPAFGVAAGQAAVVYEGDVVVGAGLVRHEA